MLEHFFICPFCWQEISMLLESSAEVQNYIEDCEVCCQPIQVEYLFQDEIKSFEIVS
ncbi:MAG: CPXCG motif-containing cysteine-rich protein [Flavobacteriaceae bacterium]|nr:CPXCG motif-containing cysteine-rich protein [Flavobacteriaceae bacterium]|tara:strand:- start:1244 stop:1414 length:171 start_codon:yes stop_codon:yes gene_type:complete